VLAIPNHEFLPSETTVVALDDRLGKPEAEVVIQPSVKGRSRDGVVVVGKVFAALEHHAVLCAVERV
jgi:hypothetical protein